MNIVVVESPAKAKTINKYLGRGYEVLASFGHVRDLPPKDGSVDPEADFHMIWEVDGKAQKRLADIARAVKGADKLILATDPDREGEALSWHVLEVLKEKTLLKDVAVARRDVRGAAGRRRRAEDPAPRHRLGRGGRGVQAGARDRRLHGDAGRLQARPAQPLSALHHLDAAAGGEPQARLRPGPHDARRAAALRGHRPRRRDRRTHYLYADRRRRH